MLTLLRNISASAIPNPFAFLDYFVIFLPRQNLVFLFTHTICYHFDPVASFSFEPALIYLDIIISSQLGILPPYIGDWTIGVMSIPDLQALGFTIRRGHSLDTIERRRDAVEQFTDRQWKYFSSGPPEYHVYPKPPPPPSQPPTISDVIVAPFFGSIIVGYTVSGDSEIKSVYAEVLDSNTYERIELKNVDHVPDGAVSYSAAFNFQALAPRSYIVKMYAVDTNDNITTRKEYGELVDMIALTINMFTTTAHVHGDITVDVNVIDDSGGAVI
jgi:hypothetical protein